ncbi:hypothetical protein GDO81_009491 [Engystomops pustulosus]|uniref:Secreted protein n=1 Tax=Engystomops pustulosus TaxID=76066 RepID=A0AAV7BSE4_ENGPU|nr:hypothetical protein GDO81_009491 [Engystomops pustulosus]
MHCQFIIIIVLMLLGTHQSLLPGPSQYTEITTANWCPRVCPILPNWWSRKCPTSANRWSKIHFLSMIILYFIAAFK